MTTNLWSEQRDLICLNCARRIVSPPAISSKYSPLREYLFRRGRYSSLVTLTFPKIESIINGDLPFGALRKEKWWRSSNTSQGHAWMSCGWKVQSVSLKERLVTFKKIAQDQAILTPRRRRRKKSEKTFTPVPVKPRRVRKPSKTRVSKVLARARNIERRRMSSSLKIKIKPRSAYEKRMYRPDAKPSRKD